MFDWLLYVMTTEHQKRPTRIRCTHRYKGIFGRYQPRMKKTRDGYLITEYKCQIIGCNHWKPTFRNKI